MGMKKARIWMVAATLAAALGLAWITGSGAATGDGPKGDVLKIADAVKKGDMDGARKMAATVATKLDTLEDRSEERRVGKKYRLGFGPKDTDGIESKIRETARDGVKKVKDATMNE